MVRVGRDGVDREALPDDAALLTSQTETVSEAFVRHGPGVEAPTSFHTSGRLSIRASSDRGGFKVGAPVRIAALFDDAPLASAQITVVAPYTSYPNNADGEILMIGDNGDATFTPSRAGPLILFVRNLAAAPSGAETDVRSYTTAITIDIAPASAAGGDL